MANLLSVVVCTVFASKLPGHFSISRARTHQTRAHDVLSHTKNTTRDDTDFFTLRLHFKTLRFSLRH
uniref:Putative secreted peptide n=1 Tax=Anopheles braziliensis TaxID=58242 RepID=A0A2M3ZWR8_9DIPT